MKLEKHLFDRLCLWVASNRPAWLELRQQTNWLRQARRAQDIRGVELARRLGVSPARVSVLEADESRGALTLKTMQKTAAALDCEFVYLLIPKKALSEQQNQAVNKPKIRVQTGG